MRATGLRTQGLVSGSALLQCLVVGPAVALAQPAAPSSAVALPPQAAPAGAAGGDYGTQRTCTSSGGRSYCYSSGPKGYCYYVGGQTYCYPHGTSPGSATTAPAPRPSSSVAPTPAAPYPVTAASWPGSSVGGPAAPSLLGPAPAELPQGMVSGETERSGARTLDGHTFPYPRYLGSAFVTTSFQVGAGIEFYDQSEVEAQFEPAPGQVQSFAYDRELVFARLRAALDIAPWEVFSFGLGAQYLAQVGVSEQSLFLFGAETGYGLTPNLHVRLWRSEASGTQLGLRLQGDFDGGLRAVPQGLLRELALELAAIAQDQGRISCLVAADFACAFEDVDLVTAIQLHHQSYGASAKLDLAQAFGRAVGLQLSLGLGGGYQSFSWRYLGDIDAGTFDFNVGIGPSFDFYPSFPLGLAFEYLLDVQHTVYATEPGEDPQAAPPSEADDTTVGNHLAAGLYFTGRRDLMLGAILGLQFVDESAAIGKTAAEQPSATIIAVQFDMRYFF